ncbi:MAG: VOC family protein [Acidimicrobiales bacterium]|nr:MAG: VOC family protein [Acidimicrobiales bacterium]
MFGKFPVSVFLATSNEERCQEFYQNTLGLSLVDNNPYAIVFELNGVELRISKVPSFTPHPWTVLDWQVDKLATAMAALIDKGVEFERFAGMHQDDDGIWTTPDGVKIAWFKDPDGNVLSVSKRV